MFWPPTEQVFYFFKILFLPLQWRHKWRVIVLLSRSLLNVSPTQIFGQSQEERNVSGATWGGDFGHAHIGCVYNLRGNHVGCLRWT